MSGSLFHSENLGRTPFYFWYGMVVGGKEWEDNQKDEPINKHKIHERDDVAGWGHRCKVAILGHDPAITEKGAANSELVMAEVMIPTTGGGGVGGPVVTPTLGNNSFVIGFYKDGVNAREPIIMGVLPNVSQSRMKEYNFPEKQRYIASTGYRPGEDIVANDAWWSDGDKMETGEMVRPYTAMLKAQKDDGNRIFGLPSPNKCKKEMDLLQTTLNQLIGAVNTSRQNSFFAAVSDANKNINAIINTASSIVSSYLRKMIQDMRAFVLNLVNKGIQKLFDITPPNLESAVSDSTANPILDAITCAFNAVLNKAETYVTNFITNLISGAANVASSTIEGLIGGFLSSNLGSLVGAIDAGVNIISGLISGDISIGGAILNGLNAVFGYLKIFTCQQELACPSVTEWSIWYGTSKKTNITSGSNSDINQSFNSNVDMSKYENANLSQIAYSEPPTLSGPPSLSISGGGTSSKSISRN